MWKAIRRWWRVMRDKECYKCGSTHLTTSLTSSSGTYVLGCNECGVFTVKGY